MWKFLKTMEAEDATTTGDLRVVSAEAVQVAIEVLLQEEKETLLQDVKADLEATEVQHLEKVVLVQEVVPRQEQGVSQTELQDHLLKLQDAMVVHQKDQLDVLKVLATLQEKNDQEEVKSSSLDPLQRRGELWN
jgi:hypothetical protein